MGNTRKVLLVEDDVLVARIYARKLEAEGFHVRRAEDGLAAIRLIQEYQPDLVVLDIMLPKLNGVEVLKFLRQHPASKATPVVVFSNAFLNELWQEITALGVQEILLKSSVTPPQLVRTILRIIERPVTSPPAQRADSRPPAHDDQAAPAAPEAAAAPAPKSVRRSETATGFSQRIRRDFVGQIPTISASMQLACQEFIHASDLPAQLRKIEDVRRKIGFLTHMTGMAGWHRMAQLSSAFEALLYELHLRPATLNDSARHTVFSTVTLLAECLARANPDDEQCFSPSTVLVVDDDAVSTRVLAMTLDRMKMEATSVPDPIQALEMLRQHPYDVVLLDINLPTMSGLTLCEKLRQLPHHANTPVIFFTRYAEFEPQARCILNQGDDLISKPILPIELTVKVIAHVLKQRLAKLAAP